MRISSTRRARHFASLRQICAASGAVLLVAGLALAAPVDAQGTYTWTGATSGVWETATNWSPQGVPGSTTAGDRAVFAASTRTQITIASFVGSLELRFDSDAPAYEIAINAGGLYLDGVGIDNASTTTHPTFSNNGRVIQVLHGSIANSTIVNAGDFSPSNDDSTNAATLQNEQDGSVDLSYLSATAGATGTSIGALSGAGTVFLGHYALTVGRVGSDNSISGVIADGGSLGGVGGNLDKVGGGLLTLSATNTYTGTTTIESGTLRVDGRLPATGAVALTGGLQLHAVHLAGSGAVGNVSMGADTWLNAGDATPDTTLTMASLSCRGPNDFVDLRIGSEAGSNHGTSLNLASALMTADCPALFFWFESAGEPLVAGTSYPIAFMGGVTDFTPANLDYTFGRFAGYPQARGHFVVEAIGSTSQIFFIVDDIGDAIFNSGFEQN